MRFQAWVNTYPLVESFLEKGRATGLAPEIRIPGLQFGLFRLLWANYFVFHFLLKEPRVLGLVTHLANYPRALVNLKHRQTLCFANFRTLNHRKLPIRVICLVKSGHEELQQLDALAFFLSFFLSFLALSLVSFTIRQC